MSLSAFVTGTVRGALPSASDPPFYRGKGFDTQGNLLMPASVPALIRQAAVRPKKRRPLKGKEEDLPYAEEVDES